MKLTFCWLAPPKSRMVSPVVSRIWVKNSSSPRLGRVLTTASDPRPPNGERLPGEAEAGPMPCGPPFVPRKRPLSGSNIGIARELPLHLGADTGHHGLRVRSGGRRCRRGLRRLRRRLGLVLHDVDAALEVGAVLDDDPRRPDVARKLGILADLDLVGGFHI